MVYMPAPVVELDENTGKIYIENHRDGILAEFDLPAEAKTFAEELLATVAQATREHKKYTVLFSDGIHGSNPMGPEAPRKDNQAATITEARELFRYIVKASMNDYVRAEGYSEQWCEVVLTSSWDGISYGDITGGDGVCRFVYNTRRNTVRRESY